MQPRPRHIQRFLWTDIPYTPERLAVEPDLSFYERAGIEKRVRGRIALKRRAIKARPFAPAPLKRQFRRLFHRQWINLPSRNRLTREADRADDSFSFLTKNNVV